MTDFEREISRMELDRRSKTPVWLQVYKGLKAVLSESSAAPGVKMPSLRRSGALLSISYLTVSKAIDRLVDEGSLETRKGSGVYLAKRPGGALKSIGVIMDDGSYSSMLAEIFRGISLECDASGVDMIIHSDMSLDSSQRFIERLLKERSNVGFAIYGDKLFEGGIFIEAALRKAPMVAINRCQNLPVDGMVYSDDSKGMAELVEALAAKGHREVLYFSSRKTSIASVRRQAFEREAAARGISYEVLDGVEDVDSGYLNAMRAVVEKRSFSAIACWNDNIALGVIRFLHSQGVKIPGDVAVAGFGNIEFSDKVYPRLSTVDQGYESMGRETVRLLLRAAKKRSFLNPARATTETRFVSRESL